MSYISLSVNLLFILGWYHRYRAEFATGDKQKDLADKSLNAYKAASMLLSPNCP